jgi:hypothetical protein
MPCIWLPGVLASAGRLGLRHGRMIWAAIAFPSAVILQEMLKDIY